MVDSVYTIKKLVFEEKTVSPSELMQALENDFVGYEAVQTQIFNLPKFGNDNSEVDVIGRELVEFAWEELRKHETPRGGRYIPSVILLASYQGAGKKVAATPDGRKALTVLTDSVGAAQGRDVTGPTALINSVSSLPLRLAIGTPVLNIRLQRKMLNSKEGLVKAATMIRTYFQVGGLQIQVSVISTEDMKSAQFGTGKIRESDRSDRRLQRVFQSPFRRTSGQCYRPFRTSRLIMG